MHISELKAGARGLLKENAPKIFVVSIIFILVVAVLGELELRLPGTLRALEQFRTLEQFREYLYAGYAGDARTGFFGEFYSHLRPSGAALAAVIVLITPIVKVGYMNYCIKISRRQGGDYKDIFNGFLVFGKIIIIFVVTTIFIFLWSLLFFFPGIIAFYKYRQAYYILLDNPEKGALQCIRESTSMMKGNKADLLLLDLSFIGWFALDIIVRMYVPFPFPIIPVWLTPYSGLAHARYYNRLSRYSPAGPDAQGNSR